MDTNFQSSTSTVQTEFSVPSGIGFEAYSGSLQEILRDNIGKYIDVEFLIGTENLMTRSGVLYAVGVSYIVIDTITQKMVCDIYSIKFVTFRASASVPPSSQPGNWQATMPNTVIGDNATMPGRQMQQNTQNQQNQQNVQGGQWHGATQQGTGNTGTNYNQNFRKNNY